MIPTENLPYFWAISIDFNLSGTAKILVIRFSSIGDIVLTTPVVRCLKKQLHGESEIHFLVKENFSELLVGNPYIDKIHIIRKSIDEVIEPLIDEQFHYVIDLQKNFRSLKLRRKLKVLSFDFPKLNIQKWILVNFKIDLLPDLHVVDRYFEAVWTLGIENDQQGLDFFIPTDQNVDVHASYSLNKDRYIAMAIGGAHGGKKLSPNQLQQLCEMLDFPIVLLGGKEDTAVGESISERAKNTINTCGTLSIHQSASVIEQSKLVVTHDSGMMHIAAALGKKIISIWGATVPRFGMYPYLPHPDSEMIQADHLHFRPTSKLGNKNSRRERRTTEEIDLEKVVGAVQKRWS